MTVTSGVLDLVLDSVLDSFGKLEVAFSVDGKVVLVD